MDINMGQECCDVESKSLVCRDDSIRGRLIRRKAEHEERLATVNAALDALDKNPEVAGVLELIQRAR